MGEEKVMLRNEVFHYRATAQYQSKPSSVKTQQVGALNRDTYRESATIHVPLLSYHLDYLQEDLQDERLPIPNSECHHHWTQGLQDGDAYQGHNRLLPSMRGEEESQK